MSDELTSDFELCEKAESYLEKDDAEGLVKAFESGELPKHRWLLWPAIHARAWNCLRAMWDADIWEDGSDYDHKDFPLIFDLIFDGQSALACEWLDRGYYPETSGGRDWLRIAHAAAREDQPDVLKKLISLGADVNAEDYDLHTPLWYAAQNAEPRCAEILLEAGAWLDGRKENDDMPFNTPLSVAATGNIVNLLLEHGADPEIPCYSDSRLPRRIKKRFGFSDEDLLPLTKAAIDGRNSAIWEFLKKGISADCGDGQPLRWLAALSEERWRESIVRDLVEAGANPDGVPGREPLLIAALAGKDKICNSLLEHGATPLPEALALAAESGNLTCVRIVADRGIGYPQEAARIAARSGKKDILYYLLGRFPTIDRGHILHGLIENCDFATVLEFITQGADTNVRDEQGLTPLAKLFTLDRRKETWRLVERIPSIFDDEEEAEEDRSHWRYRSRPDNWRELLERFEDNVIEVAKKLMEHGADLQARDGAARSILWHAASGMWYKTVPWLVELGLSLDDRDKEGISAFEAGCLSGEELVLLAMLGTGYDMNTQDENGDTALLKAARSKENRLMGFRGMMLRAGADPDLKNAEGVSFRDMAGNDKYLGHELESMKWGKNK